MAEAAGPLVPGAARLSRRTTIRTTTSLIFFTYLYAPTVLGLGDRAAQEHPRADGARRAGDPSRHLQGAVQRAGRRRLQHRGRAPVSSRTHFSIRAVERGNRRLRRRPAARAALSADRPTSRATDDTAATDEPARRPAAELPSAPRGHAAPSFAGVTGCTARSRSTAAGSIRARAARS